MITVYTTSFRLLARWGSRLRYWAYQHPHLARLFTVVFLVMLFGMKAQAAHAAGFLPEDSDFEDSAGNKFSQYGIINVAPGDPLHPGIVIVSFFVQLIWAIQYFFTGVILWLFDFLLSFTWIEWLAAPFNALALWLQGVLGDIHWIPFALTISALVGGIAIMVGRLAGGLWEMLIAAVVAVMATGILSNPVATLTAAGGVLTKAQEFGGQLASSIVVDKNMLGQTQATMSDAFTTTLMDIFVRTPYQVISYGMVLPDKCQEFFDKFIQSGQPQPGLRECAPAAAQFSYDNPSAINIVNALISAGGVTVLNTFGIVISILLVMAAFFFLVAALKSMMFAYAAVAPMFREQLWRSLADTFMGLFSLMVMTVLLSMYLKLTGWIMSKSGYLPHQLRMVLLMIFMTVMIVLVVRARKQTLRMGHRGAAQLSKLGLGMRSQPRDTTNTLLKMSAVTQMAKMGMDLLSRSPKTSTTAAPEIAPTPVAVPAPVNLDGPKAIGTGPVRGPASASHQGPSGDPDPIVYTQVPDEPRPGSAGRKAPAIAQKAAAAGQAALVIGKGAAAGGVAGAAAAAGGLVVRTAATKAATAGAAKLAHKNDIGELKVVRVQEASQSRFQVDSTGAATVRRDQGVQNVTTLPPRPAPALSAKALARRRELEQLRPVAA